MKHTQIFKRIFFQRYADKGEKCFNEFKKRYQPNFDKLDEALTSLSNEIITCGFVFDPAILKRAADRLNKTCKKLNSYWCVKILWINGFGKLQGKLSSRDAQVMCSGISNLIDVGDMPPRLFDSRYDFLRLGLDFIVGNYGWPQPDPDVTNSSVYLKFLCRAKATALKTLCNVKQTQSIARP